MYDGLRWIRPRKTSHTLFLHNDVVWHNLSYTLFHLKLRLEVCMWIGGMRVRCYGDHGLLMAKGCLFWKRSPIFARLPMWNSEKKTTLFFRGGPRPNHAILKTVSLRVDYYGCSDLLPSVEDGIRNQTPNPNVDLKSDIENFSFVQYSMDAFDFLKQ